MAPLMNTSFLSKHKFLRLIWDDVYNHPYRPQLSFLHGSVLVANGKPVATGLNSPFRCWLSERYKGHSDANLHSEMSAINSIRRKVDLTGCDMYNLRLTLSGIPRNSKPCNACLSMMFDYGIRKCYFTNNNGDLEFLKVSCAIREQNYAIASAKMAA